MSTKKITTYKGFDKHWKCRGFQYAVGKTYKHEGSVEACASGFHACEYPLDVLSYYAPVDNNFAVVEQSGELSRHPDDSKVASSKIKIKAQIDIVGLVKASIEYTTSKCEPANTKHFDGPRSASSATGYNSASSATGDRSASSAMGDNSASSATGDRSASLTNGSYSSSEIKEHEDSRALHGVAVGLGYQNKARAPLGSAIVLAHRNSYGEIIHIRASKIGDNGIEANKWYSLNEAGEFVEVIE